MRSKNTLSLSEARKKIFKIADEVQKPDTVFFLTEKGKVKAVIMSLDEFDSWRETVEILSDPDTMAAIRETEKDLREGRTEKFIPWEKVKKDLGLELNDKGTKTYVSRTNRKKRVKAFKKN